MYGGGGGFPIAIWYCGIFSPDIPSSFGGVEFSEGPALPPDPFAPGDTASILPEGAPDPLGRDDPCADCCAPCVP